MTEPATVTKRLHIGGLTPNITTTHLRDRFKIFGQVDEVEELQADALGQARPFAYLTMQITPPQLKRCMNILSGSMYRGAQLRIAEAKPRYTVKVQQENKPSAEQKEKAKVKKRKRSRREMGPEVGIEAQDMRVVNEENHKRSKFWKITQEGHLIRPIAIRPTHTLPRPTSIHLPADPDKAASTSKLKRNPPSRQRRRVIDPTLWNPVYLSGEALSGPKGIAREIGEWVFEETIGDESDNLAESDAAVDDDGEKVTLGVWRKIGGEDEGEEEIVKVKRTRLALDMELEQSEEGIELDLDWGTVGRPREASPLFGNRGDEGAGSPLFSYEQDQDGQRSAGAGARSDAGSARSASPLFASRETLKRTTGADDGSDGQTDTGELPNGDVQLEEEIVKQLPRSLSPLFAARQLSTPKSAEQHIAVKTSQLSEHCHTASLSMRPSIPKELINQAKSETSLGLSVISSLLAETPDTQYVPVKPARNEWAGFDESDSDDDDIFQGRNVASEGVLMLRGRVPEHEVLRLRGGAPGGVEEDVDMDGNSDSDSDSDSDSGSEVSSTSSASSTSSGSSTSSASSSSSSSPSSSSSSSSSSSPSGTSSGSSSSSRLTSGQAAAPAKSSLKSLFNPTTAPSASFSLSAPTAGFSLSAIAGDLDLTEELDIPLAPHLASTSKPELELLATMTPRQVFDPSPDIPLFFAPAEPTKTEVSRAGWAKHPITAEKEEKGDEYRGFWRVKTDEEMRERWDRVKGELTQEWKRRGREARKQRKRRGGGEGDD